jgi:competence protein ComEC
VLRTVGVYLAALVFTSLVAGLATAPFAAFHFNRTAPWGLAANLAAVPVMGLWIAPMAVLSGVLAPFGLSGWPLEALGAGIGWVLRVAHEVAGWPGAVRPVAAAPGVVLGLIALGGLWLALWRGWLRLAGGVAVALGLALWIEAPPRPTVLIAPEARLVGVLGPQGRALDGKRAQGFAAETWLRRDGDLADQETAAARPGFNRTRDGMTAELGAGWRLSVLRARAPDVETLRALCEARVMLVARHGPEMDGGPCVYLGAAALARMGAVAVEMGPEGPTVLPAIGTQARPWSARSPGQ